MLECVINLAEGRRDDVLDELGAAAGPSLRDRHRDRDHHRAVFTLINEAADLARDVRALVARAMDRLDLATHDGVHPRFGVVDVVPFVPLAPEWWPTARSLRDETAAWIAHEFAVPVFLYGPLEGGERSLPDVRRGAFTFLTPDVGPATPHPTRGACAVGARDPLVAWNLWVEGVTPADGRRIAAAVRRREVRALALEANGYLQISCNLVAPLEVGPSVVYDEVKALLAPTGRIVRAELVGLAPAALLAREPEGRWAELDLSPETTIESRLAR